MNTSVQIKTHTNKSASYRNVENLRESEQFKNPHIEVLLKTPNYKFEDDVLSIPKADKKSEKERQSELRKVNNKINTYSKRLEIFKTQNNHKKVEALTRQIADLQIQKEQLKEQKTAPETRGKKRKKNYIEFIFALTKSNQYIDNIDMQNVLKSAFKRMQKTKIIKQLTGITGALHLDQHSLHIHYIAKLPSGQTWDSFVTEGFKYNPEKSIKENAKLKKKISAKTYKNIQNTFQKFVTEEILKSEIKEKTKLLPFFNHKNKKYLPLSKYKKLNPLKNEIIEDLEPLEALKAPKDDLISKDIDLRDKIVSKPNIEDFDIDDLDDLDDFDFEALETRITASRERAETPDKSVSSSLDKIKEVQEESKSSKLSAKFAEVDRKTELEQAQEPTKKRSSKKNR